MALTDKTLLFSDKVKPIVVIPEDGINNTSTSLTLCPYNSLNSTKIINTSTLRLLEHFCSPTEPPHSTAGQLWVDTSSANGTIAVNSPVTGSPVISGTPSVGSVLTFSVGTMADANGMTNPTYIYEWLRTTGPNGGFSVGTNSNTYTVQASDVGGNIHLQVTFKDDDGNNECAFSNSIGPIVAGSSGGTGGGTGGSGSSVPTGAAVISGPLASASGSATNQVGMGSVGTTLTANISGIQVPSGTWTVSYQWYSGFVNTMTGTPVGTNSPTYLVAASDVGNQIAVSVNYTNSQGVVTSLGSNLVGPVFVGVNAMMLGEPVVTGSTIVGSTLTADVSGITDIDGMVNATITYEWKRGITGGGEVAVGTNSSTYTTINADIGNRIYVYASFTDDRGYFNRKLSAPFGPITAV